MFTDDGNEGHNRHTEKMLPGSVTQCFFTLLKFHHAGYKSFIAITEHIQLKRHFLFIHLDNHYKCNYSDMLCYHENKRIKT